ncbi:MAG TPA: rRNA maturation RNase YbeY [Xanthobacteraceae bacterium]|nr:rRNA maturation RNase YbeY [Xanthobacteraceae bacterium]
MLPPDRVAAPQLEVLVNSPLWAGAGAAQDLLCRALQEAARTLAPHATGELCVVLTDDAAIRSLNRAWRGIDAPTNVLAFPAKPSAPEMAHLGDIVIAYETTQAEAAAAAKPLGDHVAHLAVHGFLHLLGYDHQADEEATQMEQLERMLLARLGIGDPYGPACGRHG